VPIGRVVVVIFKAGGAAAATAMPSGPLVAVWTGLDASVALIVNEELQLAVGVPLMTPAVESVSPAGREPEARLHV
jgi:hypothetical protein